MSSKLDICEPLERYQSLGQLCQSLDMDASEVRALAALAQVRPAMQLDSVPFFDSMGVARLRLYLKEHGNDPA